MSTSRTSGSEEKNISDVEVMGDSYASSSSFDGELDLTPEELEEYRKMQALHDQFADDENRSRAAGDALQQLIMNTDVSLYSPQKDEPDFRTHARDYIRSCRESELYLGIKERFDGGEKLTASEMTYFAMVTDDVSKLDVKLLRDMQKIHDYQNLRLNLSILISALEVNGAYDSGPNDRFVEAMRERRELNRFFGIYNCNYLYLNLAGVNLSGADLKLIDFNYADLTGANLSASNMCGAGFHNACLDNANLSYVVCEDKRYSNDGVNISQGTTAHRARFDYMKAHNIDWSHADFTDASFKGVSLYGCFKDSVFTNTDFSGASVAFADGYPSPGCSFANADLRTAHLKNLIYSHVDVSEAVLLHQDAYASPEKIKLELDQAYGEFYATVIDGQGSDAYKSSQLSGFQDAIAKNLMTTVDKQPLLTSEKVRLLDAALEHPMFQPEDMYNRFVNYAERSFHSFAGMFANMNPYHEYYRTPAIKILEDGRDHVLDEFNPDDQYRRLLDRL